MSNNNENIRLQDRMKRFGLKLTKQRSAICQAFFAHTGHRGAEEILLDARALDARVSLATVYRTLKLLQECGLADAHHFQDGHAVFEAKVDGDAHHDHLICTRCHKIVEFINDDIEKLQLRVAKAHGFLISTHKMELYGLCQACQPGT